MLKHKNPRTQELVASLKKTAIETKTPLWKRVATDLEKPSRGSREVNLYKIDKFCKDGETIIVPGKVLATGELTKKVNVVAIKFSGTAEEKINKVGKAMDIQTFMKEKIKGKGVRIIG
jgi:large subunit ribosomal protein L18e